MALTDTSIKRLKPKASRYLVSDGRGLSLEILPSGSRSWRYRYRFNGKLEKVSLGHYPVFSLQAARNKRDEYAEILAHGKSPARHKQAEKFAVAHTTTVFEFGERYFKEIIERDSKDPRPISLSRYRRYIAKLGSQTGFDYIFENLDRLEYRGPNDLVAAAKKNPYVPEHVKATPRYDSLCPS